MSGSDAREAWGCIVRIFLGDEVQKNFGAAAEAEGLGKVVVRTLMLLSSGEPTPMRGVGEFLQCDPSFVTNVVDELESRGLVKREISHFDRRAKLVRLTRKGVATRERVRERLMTPPSGLQSLSDYEMRQLRRLLTKAAAAYDWPN